MLQLIQYFISVRTVDSIMAILQRYIQINVKANAASISVSRKKEI